MAREIKVALVEMQLAAEVIGAAEVAAVPVTEVAAVLVPCALAGYAAGSLLHTRIPQERLRRVLWGLLLLAAMIGAVVALAGAAGTTAFFLARRTEAFRER